MVDTSKWATHNANGKGTAPRKYSKKTYDDNFDAINWGKNELETLKEEHSKAKSKEEKLKILIRGK